MAEIEKIKEGQTGQEVAELLYNNDINNSPIGKVEKGNDKAVTGGEVFESIPDIRNSNILEAGRNTYIWEDTSIISDGEYQTNRKGFVSVVGYRMEKGGDLIITGESENLYLCVETEGIKVVETLKGGRESFKIPKNSEISVTVKRPTDDNIKVGVYYGEIRDSIVEISGFGVLAEGLKEGNAVPPPSTEKSAINLTYYNDNTIQTKDLTYEYSENKIAEIIKNKAVLNTGIIADSEGWVMARVSIPLDTFEKFVSFGNFEIEMVGYSAFYKGKDLLKYNGSYSKLPVSLEIPEGADSLFFDISRPNQSIQERPMSNFGTELKTYTPPFKKISKIKGVEIITQNPCKQKYRFKEISPAYCASKKATVNIIFDDLNDSDEKVLEIFKEFNFPVNFAVIGAKMSGALDFYKEVNKMGGSILNHSQTHQKMNAPDLGKDFLESEIEAPRVELSRYGIFAYGFVTPYSNLHASYLPFLGEIQSYAYTKVGDGIARESRPLELSRYSIEGTEIAGNSLDMVKSKILEAVEEGEMLTLYAHKLPSSTQDTDGGNYLTENKLRAILEYIEELQDSGRIAIVSTDTAIRLNFNKQTN